MHPEAKCNAIASMAEFADPHVCFAVFPETFQYVKQCAACLRFGHVVDFAVGAMERIDCRRLREGVGLGGEWSCA